MTIDKFKNYPVEIPVFDDITKKHGKKFCGAPWSSLIFEANGGIKFCCMAGQGESGNIQGGLTNLNDIVNSPKAMEIRKYFLDGTMEKRSAGPLNTAGKEGTISYCDSCWDLEQRHNHPADPREAVTEWSQHVIDDLIANTDANGYMNKIAPAWLDIVFSNKCNFACMGCNLDNSTTIGKYLGAYDIREGGIGLHEMDDPYYGRASLTEEEAYVSNVDADALIDHIIEHQDTITHVHFQGGEPFMMPEVYKALDIFIEHDLHKPGGIYIWCHTNGSIRTHKGEDIIEKYLSKWENRFQISISHDGCGPRGEYIRYGYKDKKWLETFHRIHESGCRLGIQHSINIFNILHQEECLNWYWDNCLSKIDNPYSIGFTINSWGGIFKFDNIKYVPSLVNQAIKGLENCRDFCKQHLRRNPPYNDEYLLDNGQQYNQYIDTLREIRDNDVLGKPGTDMSPRAFVSAVNKFDEMRGTDFHKTFPELKPFWDYCNV
jgi:organic radical activating enzyme|tara:strand:- start:419 stop:1885 length:1467 start_codon:yes stop_codon:yes gene_type:complete